MCACCCCCCWTLAGKAGARGGGRVEPSSVVVTPVQGVVDARGEGACARGGGDEGVEVEHVVVRVRVQVDAHAHAVFGEGGEGEGEYAAVEVCGEEGVEEGVVWRERERG